jgi:hypothetical protein
MKSVVTGRKRGEIRTMRDRQYSLVSRSHLLRMTRLAQRAVDYSIKAYELGSHELCHIVRNTGDELRELQLNIGDRGRLLCAEGRPVDTESTAASCVLRVYSALQVTYFAAAEIAQNTVFLLESGRKIQSPSKTVTTSFVNGLVRLYTVALFDEQIQHARMILQVNEAHRRFDLQLILREEELIYRNDASARFELAITHCLAQIAEQAYEIADTIMQWLDGKDCVGGPSKRGVSMLFVDSGRIPVPICQRSRRLLTAQFESD